MRRAWTAAGAFVAAALVTIPAHATLPRVLALGGAGNLEPSPGWMIDDDLNLYSFPSLFALRGDRIDAEFGTIDLASNYQKDGWALISLGGTVAGSPVVAGLIVRQPQSSFRQAVWGATYWSPVYGQESSLVQMVNLPEPRIGLALGLTPAAGQHLGLLFHYDDTELHNAATRTNSVNTPPLVTSSNDHQSRSVGIALGYGIQTSGALRSLDLGVHYQSLSFDEHYAYSAWTSATDYSSDDYRSQSSMGSGLGFTARAVIATSEQTSLALSGGYARGQLDWRYGINESQYTSGTSTIQTLRGINVTTASTETDAGAALRWTLESRTMLFTGVQISATDAPWSANDNFSIDLAAPYNTVTQSAYRTTTTMVPIFAGLEAYPFSTLAVRFGLSQNLLNDAVYNSSSNTTATGTASEGAYRIQRTLRSPLNVSAGWGWTLGDFTIEGVVRTELFYLTAFAVGGIASQANVRLSATYSFGPGVTPPP